MGRRINICSTPTPIHGPVYKYDLNYSYSRSQFSHLPQASTKGLINQFSHKVIYVKIIIDPVINGFSNN